MTKSFDHGDTFHHGPERERAIAAFAAKQYGHVTRRQLLDLGFSSGGIAGRLAAGRLATVHLGVYAVGVRRNDPLARAAAAVLACGPGAVLSHWSALALWELVPRWPPKPHVTVTTARQRPRIQIHRSRTLTRADRRLQLGIWTATPARALLDVATDLTDRQRTRIVNEARQKGILHLATLAELLGRCPNHPGEKALRGFVEASGNPTRSALEDEFVAFLTRFGLPMPRLNAVVEGHERDAVYDAERLIVELDGWAWHRERAQFESDRERDATALAAGWPTLRLTRERMRAAPEAEAERLRAILVARRAGS
ncbi:MAG: DUF559 domain-containing protein [Solirubrobacteraceae bacterium]